MASRAPIVNLRQYRRAPDGHCASELCFNAIPQQNLSATHFHRRQKLSVGQHFISFRCSGDADILLDDVVVRRKIRIADRPIIAISVAARRFEIVRAPAITLPAPHQRSSAQYAQPLPGKRLVRRCAVRIFQIVHEPLVVVFHARVALLLHRPRARNLRRMIVVLQLVRRHVLGKLYWTHRASGFEQRNLQPRLRQLFCGPSACRARPHHHRVVGLLQNILLPRVNVVAYVVVHAHL